MPSKKSLNPRYKAFFYLLAAQIIWGAAGPVIKFTQQGIDPFPFLGYRFLIAGIVGFIFLFFSGVNIPKKSDLIKISILYAFISTSFALSLLFLGLEKSTVLDLSLIGNSAPILIMLGGWLFFRDRITKREMSGTIITLLGTAIVVFGPFLTSGNIPRITGNLFLLAFLLVDSLSVLMSKYLVKEKVSPYFLANLAFVVGGVTLVPFVINFYGFYELKDIIFSLELKYHAGVWYMGLISGNLAYAFLMRGVRSIEVSEAGLFGYLQPLVSTPLAVLWLGEEINIIFILGAIIIAAGVYLAETKSKN